MSDEKSPEKALMVCMLVSDLERPVEGSQKRTCSRCGAEIWNSPATEQAGLECGAQIELCCLKCAMELIGDKPSDEPLEVLPLTAEQWTEIADGLMAFPGDNTSKEEAAE